MAECPKLAAEIAAQEKLVNQLNEMELAARGEREAANAAPSGKFQTFSMVDGTKIRINPMEFYAEVERMNVELGGDELRKKVQSLFDNKVKPQGSTTMNINYSDLNFDEQTVNELLVLMGDRRQSSKGGREAMMPFTTELAGEELAMQLRLRGGNAEEIARGLARKQKNIRNLPVDMMMVKAMKKDATRHLADQLNDYAELVDTIGVSDLNKQRIARSAQYANFFEQMDALFATKVAQAFRVRRQDFGQITQDVFDDTLIKYEDARLTLDKIREGSLAAQILDAIETGNSKQLRQVATLKRLHATADVNINEPNVFTQMRLLSAYRKGNLFSNTATWIQRNVVSGVLVNSSYMMEDVWEGAWRVGLGDSFKAANYAAGQTYQGFNTAWANAMNMLSNGESNFTRVGEIEQFDATDLSRRKTAAYDNLNQAWDRVFNKDGQGVGLSNGVAVMSWLNAAARVSLGTMVENLPGTGRSTAGYSPSFTLLAAGDEINRKMAFDWKAHNEAYIQAVEEWNNAPTEGVKKSEFISKRANELAEKASFKGVMTDDELVELRRKIGADQYSDMDNETLRLKIFNDQNGLPNPANPIGAKALNRGMDVTFTQPLDDAVTGGFNRVRTNPVVGWMVPVFQTPANALKWTFSRDLLFNLVDTTLRESRQATAKMKGVPVDELPYSPEELAKARARATQSVFIAMATNALWRGGVFTDGGSFNPENRKLENSNTPAYSFSLGANAVLGMSKLVSPASSIDLIDLMGLQADVMRAGSEGLLSEGDQSRFMTGITQAYMRAIDNKSSLRGVLDLLNAISGSVQGKEVQWGRIMQSNMNGIIPLSGILTAGSRSLTDANMVQTQRRQMSNTELEAIGKDRHAYLFEDFAQTVARNIPLLGLPGAKLRHFDWMGRKRQKPFGLPWDVTQPFAPILVSDTPLDRWLVKHGFGSVPNANGKLGSSVLGPGAANTTMSIEEENDYREAMWSTKGAVPAEEVLGVNNTVISTRLYGVGSEYNINKFVQGRTLEEALTALSADPDYNADLDSPNSPSLTKNMDKPYSEQSRAQRTDAVAGNDPRGVYKVYNAIVNYYSWYGAQDMMRKHPDFVKKVMANSGRKLEAAIEDIQASPLGLSRQ